MNSPNEVEAVRLFISYSWSSPTHESWVLALATRLRQDGVDAILDKWDLQHGHDAYKFMEQMVTDSTVTKVLMICDRIYAEKADKREGGVGAESQIISPELYGKATQSKFAAAITELDDYGKAYVPTFYKGRIYFDFSSDEKFEAQYEEVLRWALGKPLRVKPAVGAIPRHIANDSIAVATDSSCQRALAAIRQAAPFAAGSLKEFGDALVADFEKLRLADKGGESNFDDKIVESIEAARPYVEQMISIVTAIARYSRAPEQFEEILKILERLAPFMERPEHVTSWRSWDFDNYKYLCHEIFLASFAVLLREERFDLARAMVEHRYLITDGSHRERATRSYDAFLPTVESLDSRNRRLKLNRISIHADMLRQFFSNRAPNFVDLMQGDFVLYLRGAISSIETQASEQWYPVTLVYAAERYRPFDLFARAESMRYFVKIAPLLGSITGEQFKISIAKISNAQGFVPRYNYHSLGVAVLSNAKNIGAVP